jgi:hypothetical protein
MTFEEFVRIRDSIVPDEYGCKNWPSKIPVGYYRPVRILGLFGQKKAHRLALERHLRRSIRPGYLGCHHCDNKSCVSTEPGHVYEGTYAEIIEIRQKEILSRKNI